MSFEENLRINWDAKRDYRCCSRGTAASSAAKRVTAWLAMDG